VTIEMRGEVAITQSEPGFAAQGVELLHHSPTLTFEAPAELVVVRPAKVYMMCRGRDRP